MELPRQPYDTCTAPFFFEKTANDFALLKILLEEDNWPNL